MEERARASAKADAALRELRHLERKKDRDVEDAKASLEWAARRGGVGGSIMEKLNITRDAKGVVKVLEAARNITAQKIRAADAVFVAALANTTSITKAGVNKIEQGLIEAEKEEIKRVRR